MFNSIFKFASVGCDATGTGCHKTANGLRTVADKVDSAGYFFDRQATSMLLRSMTPTQREAYLAAIKAKEAEANKQADSEEAPQPQEQAKPAATKVVKKAAKPAQAKGAFGESSQPLSDEEAEAMDDAVDEMFNGSSNGDFMSNLAGDAAI